MGGNTIARLWHEGKQLTILGMIPSEPMLLRDDAKKTLKSVLVVEFDLYDVAQSDLIRVINDKFIIIKQGDASDVVTQDGPSNRYANVEIFSLMTRCWIRFVFTKSEDAVPPVWQGWFDVLCIDMDPHFTQGYLT